MEQEIKIEYEDEFLMVVNKPRGMVSVRGVKTENTLEDWLGEDRKLVHRIDKNTAGLLLVSRSEEIHEKLQAMIKNRDIERTYYGITEGIMNGCGTIDTPLMRSPKHRTLYVTCKKGQGREAITHFEVLENFKKFSLVKFKLETGRTHQIRVHCKSISRPLLGDPEYNKSGKMSNGIGQMLESISLRFKHPITNKEIFVQIEPTELFKAQLLKCSKIV